MATNQFNNTDWVSLEILRLLLNKLVIAEMFNTNWNDEFKKDFAVGDTITLKKPARFTTRTGLGYSAQNISRQTTTISLDQIFGVDFEWDDYEKLVKLERSEGELRQNYLEPAAQKLFQEVESRAALFAYQNTPNVFGVLGTNPTTSTPFLDAEARLFDKSAPEGDRRMIIGARMMASFLGNQVVQFQPSSEIARQYKQGVVGMAHGWEWYRAQSLYRHTAGTIASTYTVSGSNQSGSSLLVNCTIGDTWKKGDVLSILNVNFLNPNTLRVPDGNQVQHFVVTADVTASGSTATLPIYPSIIGPGSPYQNVDALPVSGDTITHWPGTNTPNGLSGAQGLGLTKDAFAIAFGKFAKPNVGDSSYIKDPKTGASIRFWRASDIDDSKTKNRFDMCIGFGVLYADECAVRVVGA